MTTNPLYAALGIVIVLLVAEVGVFKIASVGGAYSGLVNDIVDKCETVLADAFGRFGLPRKSAGIYARALVGSVALTGQWWEEERHISKEEITAQVVNFVWNGLTDLKANPVLTSKK